jgi:hypothetical protein
MEGNAPLIGGSNNGSDSITISAANNGDSSSHHGGGGGSGGEDGPLLPVNIQKLTLTAEPKEERKGKRRPSPFISNYQTIKHQPNISIQ